MNKDNILDAEEEAKVIKLFSRNVVLGFSVLSFFIGLILYSINLSRLNRKLTMLLTFIASITVYFLIIILLLDVLGFNDLYASLSGNLVTGLIVTKVVWNYQIGDVEFQSESFVIHLLIIVAAFVILLAMNFMSLAGS